MGKPFTVGDEVVLIEVWPNAEGKLEPAYDCRMYGYCHSVCEGNTIFAGPEVDHTEGEFPFSTVIDEKTKQGEEIAYHVDDPVILELADSNRQNH